MPKVTELHINGKPCALEADADEILLWVLRERLGLTGSKYGCGEGKCGACTVLVDGNPRRSCITTVGAVAGKQIITIEGLAKDGRLHPVQQAFLDAEAMQCGYCTSGMVIAAAALLRAQPDATEEQILHFMEGNICRCGTYPRIVEAIRRAAAAMKSART
jgi:aerobic-type carbon monoxide dehydrogenase small subunit (CoxS/CutS family)